MSTRRWIASVTYQTRDSRGSWTEERTVRAPDEDAAYEAAFALPHPGDAIVDAVTVSPAPGPWPDTDLVRSRLGQLIAHLANVDLVLRDLADAGADPDLVREARSHAEAVVRDTPTWVQEDLRSRIRMIVGGDET